MQGFGIEDEFVRPGDGRAVAVVDADEVVVFVSGRHVSYEG
jgi:hypothetical protein